MANSKGIADVQKSSENSFKYVYYFTVVGGIGSNAYI